MLRLPQFIAICGNPTAGKTEVVNILVRKYGAELMDSGYPMRQLGMDYFGMNQHQVFSQEGKLEEVELLGQRMTVRKFLGEIGNLYEGMFGAEVSAFMIHNYVTSNDSYDPAKTYVDGSCRKSQGYYWQRIGAPVIEVVNPLAGPSQHKFDLYDPAAATHRIVNDAQARGAARAEGLHDLEHKVDVLVEQLQGWVPSPPLAPVDWDAIRDRVEAHLHAVHSGKTFLVD